MMLGVVNRIELRLLAVIISLLLRVSVSDAGNLVGSDGIDSLDRLFEVAPEDQISIPEDADLSYYVALAMKRSPVLRASFYRWQAALEKSGYAGALPDPVISFSYFIENVETRVGPQEQRVGLRQVFPWFGTLGAMKDVAKEDANADYREFESVRLRLAYEVKAAYYDYHYIGRDLQITRDNLELLRFWESVAQSKYKVGLKRHPDVIKAQVELGTLDDRLKTLEERLEPAAAHLRAVLNLAESARLPLPNAIEVSEFELERDSVIDALKRNNPDLQALSHSIEKEEAGVRLAGVLSRPQFTVGLDYILTGEAVNSATQDSGKDPWIVGVGVTLPIWFGKNSARKAEAQARMRMAEYGFRDKESRLLALAEKVLFDYADALRKIRLYRDGLVPKAEQLLNVSYASYQAGETDFLDVLDAQRQLLDFQLTVERERVRLGKTAAEIEMLTGIEIENFGK